MSSALNAPGSPILRSNFVDNPPNARRTMEALREMGYDSYASILDLIDNSIDAQATYVRVNVSESKGDVILEIEDDGCGMDEITLSEALRLGSDTGRETGDLGKFGMGLVTASIGLSQCVEVLTREQDGPVLYGGFDLEVIAVEDRFVKWIQPAAPEQILHFTADKGTKIRLSKTDRITNRNVTQFATILRNRVGQVFRKFLSSGFKIDVNGRPAEKIDPLMLSDPQTKVVLETELPAEGGATVSLKVVDVPDYEPAGNSASGIVPKNSGFYIVRNNREIMEAETFDFYKKHPDYSHFRAELCFDGSLDQFLHTDVKKIFVQPPQSFLDKLRQATQHLITASGKSGRQRANTQRGEIDHSAAETNITRRASLIPKPKALVERRVRRGKSGTHPKGNGDRVRTPKHVEELRTVSGLKVVFNEANHGDQSPFYSVGQTGRTITVTYNREHPFWRELVEHASDAKVIAILDYLVFAMANTELLVPEQASIVKSQVNTTLLGLLV